MLMGEKKKVIKSFIVMNYLSAAGFLSVQAAFHRNEQKAMAAWKEGNQSKK